MKTRDEVNEVSERVIELVYEYPPYSGLKGAFVALASIVTVAGDAAGADRDEIARVARRALDAALKAAGE